MPTITKSIGTASRDYSTITLWEADLDDTGIYASGDAAVGECYNDSVLDEAILINGGGTVGLASTRITVPSSERHDGTAGIGSRLTLTTGSGLQTVYSRSGGSGITHAVEWLEVYDSLSGGGRLLVDLSGFGATAMHARNLLVFGNDSNWGNTNPKNINLGGNGSSVVNTIVYDCVNVAASMHGIIGTSEATIANCTVFNVRCTSTAANYGISWPDTASNTVRNALCLDTANSGSGSPSDYEHSAPASSTVDHNASSDTSASGTGSLTSIVTADQFVSTTGGSEDLHLKSGSDCIDAGTDLGTTPSGVNIDIDGRDRDAQADTWDIGADEFVNVDQTVVVGISSETDAALAVTNVQTVALGQAMETDTALKLIRSMGCSRLRIGIGIGL